MLLRRVVRVDGEPVGLWLECMPAMIQLYDPLCSGDEVLSRFEAGISETMTSTCPAFVSHVLSSLFHICHLSTSSVSEHAVMS
jgi:hypothetical protein